MNDLTFKLLEKALQVSPEDWETRAHLIDALLARAQGSRASEILRASPVVPVSEEAQLLKARVELETDARGVIATLEGILARNKASAPATVRADDATEEDVASAVAVLSRGTGDTPEANKDDEMLRQLGADENARRVTFDDLGGMQEVIERIRMNIVYPFKNPEVFRKFNKRPGGGIPMYGPPGCGKTHLARATAGECGANFISIPITDILSK